MKEYSAPSRILSLSGTWKLSADGVKEIPSKVPGDVLDDLRSAGLIKDPCSRMDYLDCVWCGEKEWVCRKIFRGSFPAGEMHDLVFDGLSYVAEIELNGKHLATHKTMMRGLRIPVAGILRDKDDSSSLIPEITVSEARALYESGVVSGGMIPKVECCIEALQKGVKNVIIMDGRVPHSILMEILTDEGAGTMVTEDK